MSMPDGLNHIGNTAILDRPLMAFFCSVRCPGNLLSLSYNLAQRWRAEETPLIGGFHSPVEKQVFNIIRCSTVPVCVVLARGLPTRMPAEYKRPLDDGRLLILSPFDAATDRSTLDTAERRNQIVGSLATQVFVAYAAPGSKTEKLSQAAAQSGKPCFTFDDPRTKNLLEMGFRTGFSPGSPLAAPLKD